MLSPSAMSVSTSYSLADGLFSAEADDNSTNSPDSIMTCDSLQMLEMDFAFLNSDDDSFVLEPFDGTNNLKDEVKPLTTPQIGGQIQRKITRTKHKKRDAQQLARCREHSARSRERRKAEREALDNFVLVKTEECDNLKGRIRTLEAEVQCMKQLMVQNAIFLQQQAMTNPAVILPAMTALAQVQAMAAFQAPQPIPCRRDSNGLTPICPRPATTNNGMEMATATEIRSR